MTSEVPMLRLTSSEWRAWEQAEYVEKRQLFLRSYHFSRKKSRAQRVGSYAVRVRRLICARLRSARRLPRRLWYRLRAWCSRRRLQRHLHAAAQPYRSIICSGGNDCSW
ncbi:uncharacterized protein M6B38_355690 [Iris pallida]|uniref:Ribosomal protein S14 n=1 Tax=Iris pallida TaxID=29817 RepID=A0AAX6GNF2_IRIPA|nr:uncharacterized protein M6B38_415985 [Iris pallida]KAJ6829801.1 uncharacterized protein M6B38_355690 [Iris pallida]